MISCQFPVAALVFFCFYIFYFILPRPKRISLSLSLDKFLPLFEQLCTGI